MNINYFKYLIKVAMQPLIEKKYFSKYHTSSRGTKEWLIGAEIKYGGIVNAAENNVSPHHTNSLSDKSFGFFLKKTLASLIFKKNYDKTANNVFIGGDRMFVHGYAKKYSDYLMPYVQRGSSVVLAEFGILKGTGIAIWCDLFENARILGLDIDLGHINRNMDNLKSIGAFKKMNLNFMNLISF